MRASILTLAVLAFFSNVQAQFTATSVKITDDLQTLDYSQAHKLGKKAAGNKKDCSGDTLDYGRYKATALVGINISLGYRLGQYYETPGDVTVSGFEFYAWQNMQDSGIVEVYCQLYEAGADSLPSGAPIRTDTVWVDSTFGGGALSVLNKRAVFETPYTTSKPFIVVLTTNDTNRVAVVTSSYAAGDGQGENLGCGTVGGRWYQFDDLNIGGTPLDCDVILEPHVSYTVYNDFDFKDCYNYNDTVKFENTSSPFYFSRVYNRYKYFGIEQYCHRWDFYGTGSNSYMEQGAIKYFNPANRNVRLISTNFQYRGGGTCIDTVIKTITFQPDPITFVGDKNICSGDFGMVDAVTTAGVHWTRLPTDSSAFLINATYTSKDPLETNDTLYAKAVNNHCRTTPKRYIIEVTKTPVMPSITNDSICLNSLGNLFAKTNAGIIRWYEDESSPLPVHTGELFQVGPLTSDTTFYAQAWNGACTHGGRAKATIYVSNNFAPQEPTVSNDTILCAGEPGFYLHASSTNNLRWFDVAAGGTPISTADSIYFDPIQRGDFYRYVDSYNGNCASSRLAIHIEVDQFPLIDDELGNESACEGDSIQFKIDGKHGELDWFTQPTGGTSVFNGYSRTFYNISKTDTFYVQPFEGMCRDSLRYRFIAESISYGVALSENLPEHECDGYTPTLSINPSIGEVIWYDEDMENELGRGASITLSEMEDDVKINYVIDNRGCVSAPREHTVEWALMPDANFDYEVKWRNVTFASKLIGQGEYVWEYDDPNDTDTSMGTDVTHYFAYDGDYDVSLTVTSPKGCADTVVKTITINTVGVDDQILQFVKIYPNPVTDVFTVKAEEEILDIQIYDALGKEVNFESIKTHSQHAIRLLDKHTGAYVIRIKTASGTAVGRFMVN